MSQAEKLPDVHRKGQTGTVPCNVLSGSASSRHVGVPTFKARYGNRRKAASERLFYLNRMSYRASGDPRPIPVPSVRLRTPATRSASCSGNTAHKSLDTTGSRYSAGSRLGTQPIAAPCSMPIYAPAHGRNFGIWKKRREPPVTVGVDSDRGQDRITEPSEPGCFVYQ